MLDASARYIDTTITLKRAPEAPDRVEISLEPLVYSLSAGDKFQTQLKLVG